MATTPGPRRRETRTDVTGDDRVTVNPMQVPPGSMDRPGLRTNDINESNLPPGDKVGPSGNRGTAPRNPSVERGGRSFSATFVIAGAVLVAAFLIALYIGNNQSDVATINSTQSPIADTTNSDRTIDTTGSTSTPLPQTPPGTSDAGNTTAPANP